MSDLQPRDVDNEPLYWRGRVDAKLENIEELLRAQLNYQTEARAWRQDTDRRLERGAQHFVSHDARLDIVETSLRDHREDITRHVGGDEKEKYLTWPWLLENIFVHVIRWGVILILGYLLINAIPVSL